MRTTRPVDPDQYADPGLWDRLFDDAAMFPPGNAGAPAAVAQHVEYRTGQLAPMIGPLVVADTALAEVNRAVERAGAGPIEVSVINSSGAGGLLALARRQEQLEELTVVAVESTLRDLDDLPGNAARVAQASLDLGDLPVFVELPYAPGWERAAEVVEAEGLLGKIRTGGTEPDRYPSAEQLAEQLSVLVETDLAFKATAGLQRAWPNTGHNAHGAPLAQHGFLNVMITVHALVDGADRTEAAEILTDDYPDRLAELVGAWSPADTAKIRRRLRSIGCCGIGDPIDDLVTLGLVPARPR